MEENYPLRKFVAPEFVFGLGAINLVGQYAKNFGVTRVLVVTDSGVINAGWTDKVLESLTSSGISYTVFSDVSPNPREEQVMRGVEVFEVAKCDGIIAVGGGSPMDCAKGIGIVYTNQQHILNFEGVDEVQIPGPPLICIPTTAGSSADVSQFAIINDTQEKVKITIISKKVVPDISLIDPSTTLTMDPYLTACTGIDALTHAVEAYVSNANSPVTDMNALQAIRLIRENLLRAVEAPQDIEARSQVMLASLFAGLAFSNASLGAVHAMAHSLGGLVDSAHGECNSILLDRVIDYNFETIPDRYAEIAQAFGLQINLSHPEKIKHNLLESIRTFKQQVGITNTLSSLGITPALIPELAIKAHNDPCLVTNPKEASIHDLEKIYEAAL